jgi:hypothetical protein
MVCDFIYRKRRDWRKVVECALKDTERQVRRPQPITLRPAADAEQSAVFTLVDSLMQDPALSPNEREIVREATLAHLRDLIAVRSGRFTGPGVGSDGGCSWTAMRHLV